MRSRPRVSVPPGNTRLGYLTDLLVSRPLQSTPPPATHRRPGPTPFNMR
ncbi:hypothetical protein EYF80_059383 [Liparis tanakae]|uniref:Uncharacterized protein n=1 Tax=Liparis tanakae TaxID=230148 RepID=A0A4Z2ENY0_9TELE|nr:hypothetical protein EYF80_059383 [Liparis tanakae]